MAKLKKTLGDVNSLTIQSLMSQIDTQSKETLALWCLTLAKQYIQPLVKEQDDIATSLQFAQDVVDKKIQVTELKAENKKLQKLAAATKDPIQQAALRSIHQACSVYYNPSSTLGFGFYAAAATCYHTYGLESDDATYERGAEAFFEIMLSTLKQCSLVNESKPVKVKWYC